MVFIRLHWKQQKGFDVLCRESEATSNLSAILTISSLLTMFVVRKLGLALGEIDNKGGWSTVGKSEQIKTA